MFVHPIATIADPQHVGLSHERPEAPHKESIARERPIAAVLLRPLYEHRDPHPIIPLHPYLAKDTACLYDLEKSSLSSSVQPQNENGKFEATS